MSAPLSPGAVHLLVADDALVEGHRYGTYVAACGGGYELEGVRLADSGQRPVEVSMGVWLRRWRHKRQKSLRVVAGLSGVSPTYLCSLERGCRPIPTTGIRLVVRLADALGLPREELLAMLIREAERQDKEGR